MLFFPDTSTLWLKFYYYATSLREHNAFKFLQLSQIHSVFFPLIFAQSNPEKNFLSLKFKSFNFVYIKIKLNQIQLE